MVVVVAPVGDEDPGFGEAGELLDVEEFVADAAVEGWPDPKRSAARAGGKLGCVLQKEKDPPRPKSRKASQPQDC
jgi:hypothetical protein